jgi:hypothetical protein
MEEADIALKHQLTFTGLHGVILQEAELFNAVLNCKSIIANYLVSNVTVITQKILLWHGILTLVI